MLQKTRLYTLCIIIFIYLIGIILLSTVTLNDSRKMRFGPGGRGRAMEMVVGRNKNHIEWCGPLNYIERPEGRPVTALASFPGSGNTWLRYLLQQATGVYTGSVYMDHGLFKNGFPAELVYNSSVSVVKTHEWGPSTRSKFDRAVLLIRSPGEAIVAEFNRRSAGHIGFASVDRYTRGNGKYWRRFFYDKLRAWREMTLDWLHNFPGPLHIVTYEQLINNLPSTLLSILHFIQLSPPSPETFDCAIQRQEGIFRRRRRKKKLWPFDKQMEEDLEREWKRVWTEVNRLMDRNSSSYL